MPPTNVLERQLVNPILKPPGARKQLHVAQDFAPRGGGSELAVRTAKKNQPPWMPKAAGGKSASSLLGSSALPGSSPAMRVPTPAASPGFIPTGSGPPSHNSAQHTAPLCASRGCPCPSRGKGGPPYCMTRPKSWPLTTPPATTAIE